MKDIKNCDIKHVVESLEKCRSEYRKGKLTVHDNECVMKGISHEEMENRNIHKNVDDVVCYIEWDSSSICQLKFHQNEIERANALKLNPAPPDAFPPIKQATEPKNLGKRLAFVQKQLDYAYDCEWELGKVEAASVNNGHLTDYEFEYDFMIMDG